MFQTWACVRETPHISGRKDFTVRIKNVLNMLADAGFCSDFDVPQSGADPPFSFISTTAENAEVEQEVTALASDLSNMLLGEQEQSVLTTLTQQKGVGDAASTLF